MMKKPQQLHPGDQIAIVSLSWGGLGDAELIHRYHLAKARLENDFGLVVVPMPHALKGSEFLYQHPEARAKDLLQAVEDPAIKGIFCAIGGDDTIRLLPYLDFDLLAQYPKIFMGYSDTTVNHFMLHKAGVVSYYGPSIMAELGEYGQMFAYTKAALKEVLFAPSNGYMLRSSPVWSKTFIPWQVENQAQQKQLLPEEHGYELLQGQGRATGEVLGGCIDVFPMMVGTKIWPTLSDWQGKFLLIETSEEKLLPDLLLRYLRNLGAQGIFSVIHGILVGKPQAEVYYEEYKAVYRQVLQEYGQEELPVLYNLNIGHADPMGILPLGVKISVDFDAKTIVFSESATT